MKLTSFIIATILATIITSCANQSSPTGGPRDEDSPILLSSTPTDQQLNFTGQEIKLEFNELVTVNNMNKELIITPRTDVEYEVKFKKNVVMLKFEAPLDSNTTYTFLFRKGIKDLNEGNVPENLSVAFSTGNYLDSMMISGKISDLYSGNPVKEYSVALYDVNDTMTVFENPPLYLTKTDNNGIYVFKNIKKGNYNIYTYNDKNNNLTLQSGSETYGFSDKTIELDTILTDYNLSVFNLNVDSLFLQSARTSSHYYIIKYNKSIIDYDLKPLSIDETIYSTIDDDRKEIKIYNTFEIVDSVALITTARDSIFHTRTDTVYLKFEETKRDKDEYSIKTKIEDIDLDNHLFHAVVNFNKPSILFNNDSLFIFIDSLTQVNFDTADFTWNIGKTIINLQKEIPKELFDPKPTGDTTKAGTEVLTKISPILYLGHGAFHSIESDTSKATTSRLKIVNNESTGIIKINVPNTESPFLLQLLDSNNKMLKETNSVSNNSTLYTFTNLKPGNYRFRVLIDSNNSGSWDLGNILKNTQPEPIIYYESEDGSRDITLRANWEIGPLDFTF